MWKSNKNKGMKIYCSLYYCATPSHYCLHAWLHYDYVIMGAIASQMTSLTIVYSTVYSGADQSKHQSSASLAFVWGIHRGPLNSPHKWPVRGKCFHLMASSWFTDVGQMHWKIKRSEKRFITYILSIFLSKKWLVLKITSLVFFAIYGVVCFLTDPFKFRYSGRYISNSFCYHNQIGSINL